MPNVPGVHLDWLRQARLDVGLTQRQLGKMLGIRQHRISEIETGVRRVSEERRLKIEHVLAEHARKQAAS